MHYTKGPQLPQGHRSVLQSNEQWVSKRSFICIYSYSSCRKTSSGLPLILHYDELYNYFIIYHKVIVKEIKCKINVMHLGSSWNHPTPPTPVSGKIAFHKTSPWCQKFRDRCIDTTVAIVTRLTLNFILHLKNVSCPVKYLTMSRNIIQKKTHVLQWSFQYCLQ